MFIHPQKQWQEEIGKTPEEKRVEDERRAEKFSKYAREYLSWIDKVEAEARKSKIMVKSLEAA